MLIQHYKELYQERAAIMQFDGGITKEEAEEKALSEIGNIWFKNQNLDLGKASSYYALTKFKQELKQ